MNYFSRQAAKTQRGKLNTQVFFVLFVPSVVN